MNPHRFSFNSANMSGSIADRLAAMEDAGYASATLWPADLFVHFEDPEATIARIHASRSRCPPISACATLKARRPS
jgi:hypothetical protein